MIYVIEVSIALIVALQIIKYKLMIAGLKRSYRSAE